MGVKISAAKQQVWAAFKPPPLSPPLSQGCRCACTCIVYAVLHPDSLFLSLYSSSAFLAVEGLSLGTCCVVGFFQRMPALAVFLEVSQPGESRALEKN